MHISLACRGASAHRARRAAGAAGRCAVPLMLLNHILLLNSYQTVCELLLRTSQMTDLHGMLTGHMHAASKHPSALRAPACRLCAMQCQGSATLLQHARLWVDGVCRLCALYTSLAVPFLCSLHLCTTRCHCAAGDRR